MAVLNEAWRVLSDPARRAMYDASLRPRGPLPAGLASDPSPAVADEPVGEVGRARFAVPLPWLLVLGVLAVIFVFTAYAARPDDDERPSRTPADGVIVPGSCVAFDPDARVVEVGCGGANIGVVEAVVELDEPCPLATEGLLERSAESLICVRRR